MRDWFFHDLKVSFRGLLSNRTFTLAAIAALALALGANTAIFSVVDAVMLRPLPFPASSRLVMLWGTRHNIDYSRFEDPDTARSMRHWWLDNQVFDRIAQRNKSFDSLAGWRLFAATITGGREPARLDGLVVTTDFFRQFGAHTILGRTFVAAEDRPGDDRVIVLGNGYWQRAFGAHRDVIGRTLQVDGIPHTIIGVMEARWRAVLPDSSAQPDFYLTMSHGFVGGPRPFAIFMAAGRLREGVTLAQAQAEMASVAAVMEKESPRRNAGRGLELVSLADELSHGYRSSMVVLLAAVGTVLLICCANLASLLVARATSRQREIALRAVLGAGERRLVRQMLTESVLLSTMGGLAGLLLARWTVPLLVAAIPPGALPRIDDIRIDPQVFAFSLLLSLLTGVLCGILPALDATRSWTRSLTEAMKDGIGASSSLRGRRLRSLLIVAQFSLTLVLLTNAGLLMRTFFELRTVDLGFKTRNVLTGEIALSEARYRDGPKRGEFIGQLVARLRHVPGVESVAVTNSVPLSDGAEASISGIQIAGGNQDAAAGYRNVTADYFRIMGIRLKQGRLFEAADDNGRSVIVNETFARRFLADQSGSISQAVGRRMKWNQFSWDIVGMVGDVKFGSRKTNPPAEIYVCPSQSISSTFYVVLGIHRPLSQIVPALRSAIYSIDGDQPLEGIATMDEIIDREIATPRLHMVLVISFAALALALGAVGIYGVIGYSVARRRREIGIRMALGASSGDVLRVVMSEAVLITGTAIVVGVCASAAATRLLKSLLFGVQALDAATFAVTALVLAAIALLAAWIPARHAAHIDPMIALRHD
ncbi:MAG TPA: ABC transporter permease [Bryobacteraceae bacterium]|nr:ABC transporter permease [Bryobacteraceae bacterium]